MPLVITPSLKVALLSEIVYLFLHSRAIDG